MAGKVHNNTNVCTQEMPQARFLYLDTYKAHPPLSILPGAHLSCAGKGLSHLAVPPSIAGSDKVSNPAAFQEGGRGHRATAE